MHGVVIVVVFCRKFSRCLPACFRIFGVAVVLLWKCYSLEHLREECQDQP